MVSEVLLYSSLLWIFCGFIEEISVLHFLIIVPDKFHLFR